MSMVLLMSTLTVFGQRIPIKAIENIITGIKASKRAYGTHKRVQRYNSQKIKPNSNSIYNRSTITNEIPKAEGAEVANELLHRSVNAPKMKVEFVPYQVKLPLLRKKVEPLSIISKGVVLVDKID